MKCISVSHNAIKRYKEAEGTIHKITGKSSCRFSELDGNEGVMMGMMGNDGNDGDDGNGGE